MTTTTGLAEDAGIVNDGFVPSPGGFESNQINNKRPKPIISPTEEFLKCLNKKYSDLNDVIMGHERKCDDGDDDDDGGDDDDGDDDGDYENDRICVGINNEGFLQSPAAGSDDAIEIEEKYHETNIKSSCKKKKSFVNKMKKISKKKLQDKEKLKYLLIKRKKNKKDLNKFNDKCFNNYAQCDDDDDDNNNDNDDDGGGDRNESFLDKTFDNSWEYEIAWNETSPKSTKFEPRLNENLLNWELINLEKFESMPGKNLSIKYNSMSSTYINLNVYF